MTVKMHVSPETLGWLGRAYEELSPVSLLAVYADQSADMTEELRRDLVAQGVLEPDGTLRPEAKTALDVLARPEGFVRIRMDGAVARSEKVVYHRGGLTVSLDAGLERFLVRLPSPGADAIDSYREIIGGSRLVNHPFSVSLTSQEALILMGCLDLQRRSLFEALARGETGGPAVFQRGKLEEHLTGHTPSGTWLVHLLETMEGMGPADPQALEEALGGLTEKGLVKQEDGSIGLLADTYTLAGYFLVPSGVYNIDRGRMLDAGILERSGCLVVQSSAQDLLYVDVTGGEVLVETISGAAFLEILRRLFEAGRDPGLLSLQ